MEIQQQNIFLELLNRNKSRIYRICLSYTDFEEDAKDLFQTVLMNIWNSLPGFKYQSSMDTWVYRITLNVCLKERQLNRKRSRQFAELEQISVEYSQDFDSGLREMKFVKLNDCIKKLPASEKMIVLLYLEGLPYKEIGAITGLTENHIAVKMKRIKAKLFDCINQEK